LDGIAEDPRDGAGIGKIEFGNKLMAWHDRQLLKNGKKGDENGPGIP
jgi:hypothetical protein